MIEICAASITDSSAVFPAEDFHRHVHDKLIADQTIHVKVMSTDERLSIQCLFPLSLTEIHIHILINVRLDGDIHRIQTAVAWNLQMQIKTAPYLQTAILHMGDLQLHRTAFHNGIHPSRTLKRLHLNGNLIPLLHSVCGKQLR